MKLYELAHVLRSKNSGPFAVTLDILFDDPAVYERVKRSGKITPENIARLYGLKVEDITDFASYDPGLGFKITYLRKTASGTVGDRDVYGAQQHARITSCIRTGLWMDAGFSILFSVLLFFSRSFVVRFFTDDPAVMQEGGQIIAMLAFFYPTFVFVEILSSAMRGTGNSVIPTVLTLFGVCVLRLVLLFTVTFPHLSDWTVALCYPATWATTSVLFLIYYKCFRWMPACREKAQGGK